MRAEGPEPAYGSWRVSVNSAVVPLGIPQLFSVASFPLIWTFLVRKNEIRLLLQSHSQTRLHQDSLSILRNGGALEQLHVWSCTWKQLLGPPSRGSGPLRLLNCSTSVLDLSMTHLHYPLFAGVGHFLEEWRSKWWRVCASPRRLGESQPWIEEPK